MPPLPPAFRETPVRFADARGAMRGGIWHIAEETAIEIGFDGEPAAVMMATPADIEDLAIGFAISEGVLSPAGAAARVDIRVFAEGITADIVADLAHLDRSRLRKRVLEGRSGCGLCGVETLADAALSRNSSAKRAVPAQVATADIIEALSMLGAHQTLNVRTHSVHGAAWVTRGHAIFAVREDVGRHNALDKLIGALMRNRVELSGGYFVLSSRLSFELVQKTAMAGVSLIASLSAPTTLAIELARSAGVRLACRDGDGLALFNWDGADGKL